LIKYNCVKGIKNISAAENLVSGTKNRVKVEINVASVC
jgi:hypothetical protein